MQKSNDLMKMKYSEDKEMLLESVLELNTSQMLKCIYNYLMGDYLSF